MRYAESEEASLVLIKYFYYGVLFLTLLELLSVQKLFDFGFAAVSFSSRRLGSLAGWIIPFNKIVLLVTGELALGSALLERSLGPPP